MKTMKIFAMGFMLLWAASVNFVAAQEGAAGKDSIYGLEVSITDNVMDLSFYSTYEKNNLKELLIVFYDNATNTIASSVVIYYDSNSNFFSSKFGLVTMEQTSDDIYKIVIQDASLLYRNLENKFIRMELYLSGSGYVINDKLKSVDADKPIGNSNILTFFLN